MRNFTVLSKSTQVEGEEEEKVKSASRTNLHRVRALLPIPSCVPLMYIESYTAINRQDDTDLSPVVNRGGLGSQLQTLPFSSPLPGVTCCTCARLPTETVKSPICPFLFLYFSVITPHPPTSPPFLSRRPVFDSPLPRMFSLHRATVFSSTSSHCLHAPRAG